MNEWTEIMYKHLQTHAKDKSIEWTDDNVKQFIAECLEDGGIPMFKNRYAGKRFEVDGKPAVLAICYGSRGLKPSQWFKDVPYNDIELIESKTGEWRDFLERDKTLP